MQGAKNGLVSSCHCSNKGLCYWVETPYGKFWKVSNILISLFLFLVFSMNEWKCVSVWVLNRILFEHDVKQGNITVLVYLMAIKQYSHRVYIRYQKWCWIQNGLILKKKQKSYYHHKSAISCPLLTVILLLTPNVTCNLYWSEHGISTKAKWEGTVYLCSVSGTSAPITVMCSCGQDEGQ